MAAKINRPRPMTKHGLRSDVRSKDYLKRTAASVRKPVPAKPRKAGER